uniref:Uncharacterized protein n=1 Tax=Hyaloperonospora arabidopsidis (strain Emoy2) TaxID=559515 RepID=M4C1I7_HYAAE
MSPSTTSALGFQCFAQHFLTVVWPKSSTKIAMPATRSNCLRSITTTVGSDSRVSALCYNCFLLFSVV